MHVGNENADICNSKTNAQDFRFSNSFFKYSDIRTGFDSKLLQCKKISDFRFFMVLHALECPEYDLTIFEKSACM